MDVINLLASKHLIRLLEEVCNTQKFVNEGYTIINLLRETTETLVIGVSNKTIKNIKHYWNGKGWSKKG